MERKAAVQIQLALSYKTQPREHPRLRAYLERGFRIADLQRISDAEALVTLEPGPRPSVRSDPS